MFISKLFYLFACELKFSLQVIIQFLYLVYVDCSLRGVNKRALTEFRLFTVIYEE